MPEPIEHNLEYGREHNGYSHVGIPPACRACAAEQKAEAALTDEQREHLRHMTDGRWHDSCRWCLRRRVHGGTGLEDCPKGRNCYAHP